MIDGHRRFVVIASKGKREQTWRVAASKPEFAVEYVRLHKMKSPMDGAAVWAEEVVEYDGKEYFVTW